LAEKYFLPNFRGARPPCPPSPTPMLPPAIRALRQRRRGHREPDPQYLTCRGPSMCWTPAIILTQSRVRCTIFVNIIDCVVDAVVEQVCSYSTFKFSLLEKKKSVPWNASFLPLNAAKCVWWQGSARTRWGSLQRSPRPLAGLGGRGERVGKGKGREGEERRKGEDLPNV